MSYFPPYHFPLHHFPSLALGARKKKPLLALSQIPRRMGITHKTWENVVFRTRSKVGHQSARLSQVRGREVFTALEVSARSLPGLCQVSASLCQVSASLCQSLPGLCQVSASLCQSLPVSARSLPVSARSLPGLTLSPVWCSPVKRCAS